MSLSTLRVSKAGAVATITLSRPDKLNALNSALHADLRVALDEAADDAAIRVVVVTGEGRGFSSGADLTEAEVRFLMAEEWAETADDILWRRTKLGLRFSDEETVGLAAWLEATVAERGRRGPRAVVA